MRSLPRPFRPLLCGLLGLWAGNLPGADQPQWGQAWTRNMVSAEKNLPESFDPVAGSNVKWSVALGTQSHGSAVVAGGRVYIGTNNEKPRDPARSGDRGVLLCLDEKDGHLLWQLAVPKRDEDQYFDWPKTGMASPVTVEGDRVYVVNNRGAVVCLDAQGMANGNQGPLTDEGTELSRRSAPPPEFTPGPVSGAVPAGSTDADLLWSLDLPSAAGIWPHDGAHSSILILGDYLYVNTGTGVDNSHRAIRTPDAPSLVVIEKNTGRLVARDDEHIAPRIFHATWSSPALEKSGGRDVIVFAGGDGVVRGFEPVTQSPPEGQVLKLKKVWEYDIDPEGPKEDVHRFVSNRKVGPSDIYGMPVVLGDRLYVAGGGDIWWGKNEAWLQCVGLRPAGEAPVKLWSAPLDRHTMSTPAVSEGLVYVTDSSRKIHCIDAETGTSCWTQETGGEFWASPLVADGKIYVGTRKGEFWILQAGREKRVLSTFDFKVPISATATAANGVIYVVTMDHLYALARTAP